MAGRKTKKEIEARDAARVKIDTCKRPGTRWTGYQSISILVTRIIRSGCGNRANPSDNITTFSNILHRNGANGALSPCQKP